MYVWVLTITCQGLTVEVIGQGRSKVRVRVKVSNDSNAVSLTSIEGGLFSSVACDEVWYVSLQAVAGQIVSSTDGDEGSSQWWCGGDGEPVLCACESDWSCPALSVTCAGCPSTPQLRVDNMDQHGLLVAWDTPDDTDDDERIAVRHYHYLRFRPR